MKYCYLVAFFLILNLCVSAQTISTEDNVPAYTLPDLLVSESGKLIKTKSDWEKIRKPELLKLFEEQMYGVVPDNEEVRIRYFLKYTNKVALNGIATRKEVTMRISNGEKFVELPLLIYIPNAAKKPVPVFVAQNFEGNYTINSEVGITIKIEPTQTSQARGSCAAQWPLEEMMKRGYGLITACYSDFEPDHKDDNKLGIRALFYDAGQKPDSTAWGALSAWAWGLSRMLDYAETDMDINAGKAILMGHSRLGKAAVWAGAHDPRFAMVISSNSGCGGAALSKRVFGETIERINTKFPHWFCDNFKKYNNEDALTFDQHELLALIAPRPLYVASAEDDLWADPRGEYLSAVYATPAYHLYGKNGQSAKRKVTVNKPVMNTIGYHVRSGKHDITMFDWEKYIDFADNYLK